MTTTASTVLWRDEVAIDVAADPLAVWARLSDIPRMGEWSPVCRRCDYLDGASSATPGTRFVGHNRQAGARWSRTCVVTACEPGRELAFHTLFRGAPGTRWRYRLEPRAAGPRVVEAYELLAMPVWVSTLQRLPGMTGRFRLRTRRGMQRTLEHIKASVERGALPTQGPEPRSDDAP